MSAHTTSPVVVVPLSKWFGDRWVAGFGVVFEQNGHPRTLWFRSKDRARRVRDRIARRRARDLDP